MVNNINEHTFLSKRSPLEILGDIDQPSIEHLHNIYDLKVQPEIIRYYHVAAGFPTKPTWIKAIINGHYSTWTGLTTKNASKYFPEADETWQGHGRKTKSGLQSTKTALADKMKHQPTLKKQPEKTIYQST